MTRQNTPSVYRRILKQWPLYLMMVPGLAYLLINNYMPLAGLQLAFKKFKYALGIWKSDFNNFKNFTYLFKSSDAWIIIRNTVGYNLVFILLGTVVAIFVAILLNMVRVKRMQKFYQTVILIPHLISYVIVSYIVYAFLGQDNGMINNSLLKALDTVDNSQINVLTQRTMHRICTAATNEEVSFAYRVAIPRQRFRWRNAFSTRWRSL